MFLLPDGSLLLNEVAPRPHNSGHYTMNGCVTSQFENHVRAGKQQGASAVNRHALHCHAALRCSQKQNTI